MSWYKNFAVAFPKAPISPQNRRLLGYFEAPKGRKLSLISNKIRTEKVN
jgi:hypothetical protein